MEEGRKLREEQYAALKDKEWEDTLRREAELHRSADMLGMTDGCRPCRALACVADC